MDAIQMMVRAMGIDPVALMEQAKSLGAAFEKIAKAQQDILEKLETVLANQDAIMGAMGLYVPPPTGAIAALIEDESRRHLEAHGGAVMVDALQ